MINETIDIWENSIYQSEEEDGFRPTMGTYILNSKEKRGAVLICPGGGYAVQCEHEAEAVAMQFNAAGYHAFIIYYSVAPRKHPQPLLDASRAMCIIRKNADEWNIDENKIAICGFSAGGHLAASLGVHWERSYLQNAEGIDKGKNNPNALILCYPVITAGPFANRGSFESLLGTEASKELLDEMSLENQVTEKTVPTFIWHTFPDISVPVENSLFFASALRKKGVPFELHIYPQGKHGLSLATEETAGGRSAEIIPHVAGWMKLCIEWLKNLFA